MPPTDAPHPHPDAAPRALLRLLATSDLHLQLTGFDYLADRPTPDRGLTRLAPLIARARAEAAAQPQPSAVLLFDNGDGLQGAGPDQPATPDGPHPLMQGFAHLRYDAMGLGNHDFDTGCDALATVLDHAPCPVLCSNLDTASADALGVQPLLVLHPDLPKAPRLTVGVLALIPPQTAQWNAHVLPSGLRFAPMVETARATADRLVALGCDLVVALAHSGLSHPATAENAVTALAALPGIDAIVAGHTHLVLPGPDHAGLPGVDTVTGRVGPCPVVMPGAQGTRLGVIDLRLRHDGSRWRVTDSHVQARAPDPAQPPDPGLTRRLAPAHARTRTALARRVGQIDHPLFSHFSLIAPSAALAMVATAQAAAVRPYLRAEDRALPLLSATAPARLGGRAGPDHYTDIPAGRLALRDIDSILGFDNDLRLLRLTGAQIRAWLLQATRLFRTLSPDGQALDLVDRALPGHDFDVLHGVTYRIDLTAPATQRIRDLRLDGAPLASDRPVLVALNSYRANGGGGVTALAQASALPLPRLTVHAAVLAHLAGALPPDPMAKAPPPWRFDPAPARRAVLHTGPSALTHLPQLAGRGVIPDGLDDDGFLRLIVPF